jgi:hypothetical protein
MTEIFAIVHSLGLKKIVLEAGCVSIFSLEWGKGELNKMSP